MPGPAFIPIALPAPAEACTGDARRRVCAKPDPGSSEGRSGLIEIEIAGGRRLRVDGTVDTGVLTRVVDALESRPARAKPELRFGEDG